jgi:threonine/homoserine/homoserine lactone efflux protein
MEPVAGGEPGSAAGRTPGWREVLVVAAVVVGIVLGLAVLTSVLPVGLQDVVFRTPLAIVVLVVGTVGLLVWLARRRPEA